MRRLVAAVLLGFAFLSGCHEKEVIRSVHPHPYWMDTPDTNMYGRLAIYSVREYRRPHRVFRFPDGGVAFEVARYEEVRQLLPGGGERVIGELRQSPVRRGDFGNPLGGGHEWVSENRLRRWVSHGYFSPEVRTDTLEIVIPRLP